MSTTHYKNGIIILAVVVIALLLWRMGGISHNLKQNLKTIKMENTTLLENKRKLLKQIHSVELLRHKDSVEFSAKVTDYKRMLLTDKAKTLSNRIGKEIKIIPGVVDTVFEITPMALDSINMLIMQRDFFETALARCDSVNGLQLHVMQTDNTLLGNKTTENKLLKKQVRKARITTAVAIIGSVGIIILLGL